MSEELEITSENFDQYFHDVRNNAPQKGEVMVCFASSAEFIEGNEKRHMLQLVQMDGKIEAAAQLMRRAFCSCEKDAYRVPKAMIKDLLDGMSEEEVLKKPYDYTVEMLFYTKPEYIPKDDPHWTQITVLDMDQFLAAKEQQDPESEKNDATD